MRAAPSSTSCRCQPTAVARRTWIPPRSSSLTTTISVTVAAESPATRHYLAWQGLHPPLTPKNLFSNPWRRRRRRRERRDPVSSCTGCTPCRNQRHIALLDREPRSVSVSKRSMDVGMANGGSACEQRRKKVELVQEAIHGILEEKRRRQGGDEGGSVVRRDHEEEDDGILSSLLSKVDAVQNDADFDKVKHKSLHCDSENRQGEIHKEVDLGDIAKDLNKIKKQNMITHILLGTVIVLTAVWQFNEVSFLLAVQKKLSNPFKSLGELIKGSLKGRGKPLIEAPPLPPVGVPDVTRNDLPLLIIGNSSGNEDD